MTRHLFLSSAHEVAITFFFPFCFIVSFWNCLVDILVFKVGFKQSLELFITTSLHLHQVPIHSCPRCGHFQIHPQILCYFSLQEIQLNSSPLEGGLTW